MLPPLQRFQSLTLTHPSAERIHMSAWLINTSDFNLRSHGDRFILPALPALKAILPSNERSLLPTHGTRAPAASAMMPSKDGAAGTWL